jgi:RimJ/RimL family protein N-acetyltransferase
MLVGERVRLRAFDAGDTESVWSWYQDHEFSTLDGNIYPSSRATIEGFLRGLAAAPSFGDVSLGIETEDGALIGIVRLKRVRPEHRDADFGIAMARPWWDRGYGTDATRTILRFAFEEIQLHRVSLTVHQDNDRARRVYVKCGFVEEGRLRESRWIQGRWVDRIQMGILAQEWRAINEPGTPSEGER